jgi:hypothetical protein
MRYVKQPVSAPTVEKRARTGYRKVAPTRFIAAAKRGPL